MDFGKGLKELRKEKKLTQAQVAEHLDVSVSTYTKYETGVNEPDITMIKKIAKFFNVSIDYLLGESTYLNTTENLEAVLSKDQQELYEIYMSLNLRNQGKLIERGKVILEEQTHENLVLRKRR
ncbi:helix-turn-helix domain-containing protein [Anaerovorax sp. IOR16]|uniref:helix-turn-helix domain-containing protein n=1 Tax=Anaerovorax sp. IOR16 TaxID=2773458 RepID=UPI0019D23969|nr:helix-turn-helix transcriptional regulator [Anaerovorax sp. IOR16]